MNAESRSITNATTTRKTTPISSYPIKPNTLLDFLISFNDLVNLNESECGYNGVNYADPGSYLYMNSTTNNCFCQEVYYIVVTASSTTNFLFNQFAQMLFGKILYSPNTPAYEKLIRRANVTFENADTLLKYIGGIADLLNYFLGSLKLDQDQGVNSLKQNIQFLMQELNMSQPIDIDSIIYQTRLTIQKLYFIRNLGYCVELDRFAGYATEDKAVEIGGNLLQNSNLWGAWIFNNPEVSDKNNISHLPDIVSYKIRMNSSLTHNTIYTQDKVYYYGNITTSKIDLKRTNLLFELYF